MDGFMRSIRLVMGLLLLTSFWVIAADAPADLGRLVKLELELCLKKAAGFGERHPAILSLSSSIAMIEKRHPEIRDHAYLELLKRNRNRLEDQQALMIGEGLGDNHPVRMEIDQQLAGIDRRLDVLKKLK